MSLQTENSVISDGASATANKGTVPQLLVTCPICDGTRLDYVFTANGLHVVQCRDCRLMLLNPQPEADGAALPSDLAHSFENEALESHSRVSEARRAYARRCLREIARYDGRNGGELVQIGCGEGDLLVEARNQGYQVTGVEALPSAVEMARRRLGENAAIFQGEIGKVELSGRKFDLCVLSDILERVGDPLALLSAARDLLKPEGTLFISTPSLDSWSARWMGEKWAELKPDHLFYFDGNTIQHALFRTGFCQVIVEPGYERPNSRERSTAPNRMMVMASPAPPRERRRLSVIVPAFNEAATFEALLAGLVQKEMQDLDLEIVVVESNSSDGTREIALRYRDHPRVRLVLEDRPRGKGYAVRHGLEQATGDFIMIQDADLEYDLEDYAVLLAPLKCQQAFVLGSRHGDSWKIRHFAGQRTLTLFFNGGHWFFTLLLDLLFGLRLRDPLTMYKVFRRDCLYGLTFECNRFDFDYELLVKLVRKGYRPIEIPINYRSRSFREGKKISILRDPLTWLWALVRLRLVTVDPMHEIERQRRAAAN